MSNVKIEELRIGNYLDRNGVMEVNGIIPEKIRVFDHYNNVQCETYFKADTFNPIPLTEEWLVKFGFKEVSTNTYSYGAFNIYTKNASDAYDVWKYISNGFYQITWVQSVHELQNLIFALTGEELNKKDVTNP